MLKNLMIGTRLALVVGVAILVVLVLSTALVSRQFMDSLDKAALAEVRASTTGAVQLIETTYTMARAEVSAISLAFIAMHSGRVALDAKNTVQVGEHAVPSLTVGNTLINGNFETVDRFTRETGGAVATVFVRKGNDFVRITTSLKKENGERAIGTPLGSQHPAFQSVMEGKDYIGMARLFGRLYVARYEPIKSGTEVIGIWFVGVDFTPRLEELRKTIKSIKFGETGYVYVIDANAGDNRGVAIIHPALEGKSLLGLKDSSGHEFIHEMLDKKDGVMRYLWRTKEGEVKREKVVQYATAKGTNWLAAGGTYQDEYLRDATTLVKWLVAGCVVVALGLASLVTIVTRGVVTRPLRKAMRMAKAVEAGDLSVVSDIRSRDEVGQLLDAMRAMQDRLKAFVAEQQRVASQHEAGVVSARMEADKFPGAYGEIGRQVNTLIDGHVKVQQQVMEVIGRYAKGDFTLEFEELPGERAAIRNGIDGVKMALTSMNSDVRKLVDAAARGDFSAQVDVERYQHDYRQMVEGLNNLMRVSDTGLREVSRVLSALARGDLTEKIASEYQGTFGQLKNDCNATVGKLTEIIGQIKESAESVNVASKEIASGNSDLSSRTEEQASSLEETASSMEELTSTVKQNAENARQANQLAAGASEVAVKGGTVVKQVVETMGGISQSSKKIADIIGVIDGIAFQTNILALNAAVEAARAGEQGRGFAVVATEVRNLAQRSAAAAKEIKDLITDSVAKVEGGTKLVDEAGKTMDEIVVSVKRVTDIMAEITAASQEQSGGIEQVNTAITQMDEVTQQNAALVEEAAASAESMEEQAKNLADAVAVFKLTERQQARTALTPGARTRSWRSQPLAGSAPLHSPPAPDRYANAVSRVPLPEGEGGFERAAGAKDGIERRGPDRAKNVTRLPGAEGETHAAKPAAAEAHAHTAKAKPAKAAAGGGEWTEF